VFMLTTTTISIVLLVCLALSAMAYVGSDLG
jgi:hypothetical protein